MSFITSSVGPEHTNKPENMPTSIKPKFLMILSFKLGLASKFLHSIFEKRTIFVQNRLFFTQIVFENIKFIDNGLE